MLEIEDIRNWRGHDVVDESGSRIGQMEAVYVDTLTDEPSFITIKIGMPTRQRLVFAPLDGAAVGPDHVRVAHRKREIKSSPAIGTDGELLATAEPEVFAHYELPYETGPNMRRLARR
jgi:hypothetical protein